MVVLANEGAAAAPFAACLQVFHFSFFTWSQLKYNDMLTFLRVHCLCFHSQVKRHGRDPMLLLLEDVIVAWLQGSPSRIADIRDSKDCGIFTVLQKGSSE